MQEGETIPVEAMHLERNNSLRAKNDPYPP